MPITLVSQSLPASESNAPTLLTLPPELLLLIISHIPVPTSSTLHALSTTSRTLHTFLHTHAATISNSLIIRHYSIAAKLLGATHTDTSGGWLVPTLPFIQMYEDTTIERIKSDRRHSIRQCSWNGSMPSSSSIEKEALVNKHREMKRAQRQKDYKPEWVLRLTEPGPQFLLFLERYGWELTARWDVYLKSVEIGTRCSYQWSDTEDEGDDDVMLPTILNEDGLVDDSLSVSPKATEISNAEYAMEEFEFMIGRYCIRQFMNHTYDHLKSLSEVRNPTSSPTTTSAPPPNLISKIEQRVRQVLKKTKFFSQKGGKDDIRKQVANKATRTPTPSPTRMFGEIDPEKHTSSVAIVEKDNWVKGLLWYYGFNPATFNARPEPVEIPDSPVTGSIDNKVYRNSHQLSENALTFVQTPNLTMVAKSKLKVRSCLGGVKRGVKRVGPKIRGILLGRGCGGQFRELDS